MSEAVPPGDGHHLRHMPAPPSPPVPATPPRRRRVRTGCLTCRGRRRKCDEAKPTCHACLTRNTACRYESKLKFVHTAPDFLHRRKGASHAQSHAAPAYSPPSSGAKGRCGSSPTLLHPSAATACTQPHEDSMPGGDAHVGEPSAASSLPASRPICVTPSPTDHPDPLHSSRAGAIVETLSVPYPALDETSAISDGDKLGLLSFYRYHLGPVLDLDSVDAYWSSDLMHQSQSNLHLSSAVLTLARCVRTRVEGLNLDASSSHEHPSMFEIPELRALDFPTRLLWAWRSLLSADPSTWLSVLDKNGLSLVDDQCPRQCRSWHLRILLASVLATDFDVPYDLERSLLCASEAAQQRSPRSVCDYLSESFMILQRTFCLLNRMLRPSDLPVGSVWQSCWSASQVWYATRTGEMQQILELTDPDVPDSADGILSIFPPIVFSNPSAVLANTAHHLSAVLLLQAKPRLIPVAAEIGSSGSLSWHVLRIQRIGAVAAEDGFWDPLLAMAIIKAGRSLSHASQLSAVADILKKLMAISGMQLVRDIEYFADAAKD